MWDQAYTAKPLNCCLHQSTSYLCDFNVMSGTLISPNYPNNYPNGQNCGWNFNGMGKLMTLQFWSFDVKVCNICRI